MMHFSCERGIFIEVDGKGSGVTGADICSNCPDVFHKRCVRLGNPGDAHYTPISEAVFLEGKKVQDVRVTELEVAESTKT